MTPRRSRPVEPPAPAEAPASTLAERVARWLVLARRGRRFLVGALLITSLGLGISAFAALHAKRTYASECTLALRTLQREGPGEAENLTRKTARLKDMLSERGRLEGTIRKFGLYARVVEDRDVLEAVELMRTHVGLRARESGRFVVAFDSEEIEGVDTRTLVREVTQHLADSLADDWVGGGLKELRNEAAFLEKEAKAAGTEIDDAIAKVTVFLGAHPEFATEVQPGGVGFTAVGKPAGAPGSPSAPNAPSAPTKGTDPALNALRLSDATLAALWREHARLEADLKAVPPPSPSASAAAPSSSRDDAVKRVESAKKRYAEAQAELQSKQTRLTEEHPDMKVAQAAVATAATELREARAQLALIDAQTGGATAPTAPVESPEQARLREVKGLIVAREAQLLAAAARSSAPAAPPAPAPSVAPPPADAGLVDTRASLETEWARLLRTLGEAKTKHDAATKRYEAVLFSLKSADVAKGDLVTVIEPAYRPMKPSRSRRWLIAILGAFSSFAAGLAWIYARVRLDARILDADDVEELGLGPVLGAMPRPPAPPEPPETTALVRAELEPLASYVEETASPFDKWPIKVARMVAAPRSAEVLAFLRDDASAGAALRVIRHKLELLRAEGISTFAVTSPHPGDGKSALSTMLAMALSESQRARVLLVEGNLHRPAIARLFGLDLPREFGLSEQLVGKIEGDDRPWQVVAIGPSLHVLAESPQATPIPRVIHSGQFQEALALFGELYDYVVVDGPHVLGSGDANAIETAVEGLVFVARAEVSTKLDVRKALRQIGARRLVGFVLVDGEGYQATA